MLLAIDRNGDGRERGRSGAIQDLPVRYSQLEIAATIAESVDDTSCRMDEVSSHIDEVKRIAENVSAALGAMEGASGDAALDLVTLRAEVGAFLELIKEEMR